MSNRTRTVERLNDLNAEHELVKFVLLKDIVVVTVQLPCMPFAARHFTDMVDVIATAAADLNPGLASDLGGRLPFPGA